MNYDTYIGSRIDSHRAATLARENELRRSHADRGTTVAPARPVLDALRKLGDAWWAIFSPTNHGHRPAAQH